MQKAIIQRVVSISIPKLEYFYNEAIAAKNFLNEMIKSEKVSIQRITEDKYGRTVGELSFNGENLQQVLVKEGHAEIYKKFSKPCEWAS